MLHVSVRHFLCRNERGQKSIYQIYSPVQVTIFLNQTYMNLTLGKVVPNIRTTKSEPFKMTSKQTTKDIVSGKGNPIRPQKYPVSTNMPKKC